MNDNQFVEIIYPLHPQGEVFGVKQVDLNIASNPLLQAYQTTYKGNGTFALYESYHNGSLICIFSTRGVDPDISDGVAFKDGYLKVKYKDINGDGYRDVILYGTMEYYGGEKEETLLSTSPCKRVFIWQQDKNSNKSFTHNGHFVEAVNLREGFDTYPKYHMEIDKLKNQYNKYKYE